MDKNLMNTKEINIKETNDINLEKIFSLLKSLELQICRLENRILQLENKIDYNKPKYPFGPMNPFGPNPPGTLF